MTVHESSVPLASEIAPSRWVPPAITAAGILGLAAAWALTVDKVRLLEDPAFVPPCSVSAIVNCGSVMQSWQSSVFGFPNSLIGLVAFSVVICMGVLTWSGARLRSWVWWGLEAGAVLGMVFIHWLAFQSAYVIGALCLYCAAVWLATFAAVGATTSTLLAHHRDKDPRSTWRRRVHDMWPIIWAAWLGSFAVAVVFGLFG